MPTHFENRAARRKARYDFARSLGFTSKQASRLRDLSGRNIEREARNEARRISRKSIARRTEPEQNRLQRIRAEITPATLMQRQRRFSSKRERQENFNAWSASKQFPDWALQRIEQYNDAANTAGKRDPVTGGRIDKFNSFGYRRFYFWYVERIADFENEFYADRGDSGIRHQLRRSLREHTPRIRNVA